MIHRRFASAGFISCLILCSGCASPSTNRALSRSELEQLNQRLDRLETTLERLSKPSPQDPKAPDGPIRSLTLRIGTDDDRLRLYWADGQTSDLICTEEGKGTWACG